MSRRIGSAGLVLGALVVAGVGSLEAQDTMERVQALAREGRAEEARALLSEWWEVGREEADREELQLGIWLRGVLTVDPELATLDFRRLVVEYPTGPYTPRALARIAGAAEAVGDRAEAERAWEMLVREYPGTPQAERARARLRGDPDPGVDPPAVVEPGGERAEPEPDAAPPPAVGAFAVQLGAFFAMTRARELMERARAAGLEPRIVRIPGSELARVRVGRFVLEASAVDLRRRVVRLGFDALVSDTAAEEVPVGG